MSKNKGNDQNPNELPEQLKDGLSKLGDIGTLGSTLGAALIPIVTQLGGSERSAKMMGPAITGYLLLVAVAAMTYYQSAKPEEDVLKGVGGKSEFDALVARDIIRDGKFPGTWTLSRNYGIPMDTAIKWGFMSEYAGGRSMFGSIVGIRSNHQINQNITTVYETRNMAGMDPWSPKGIRNFLGQVSSQIVGSQDSLFKKIIDAPPLALLAVGLIFTVGIRVLSPRVAGSYAPPPQGASDMVSGIMTGFMNTIRHSKELLVLVPVVMMIKYAGPLVVSWISALYMVGSAKETKDSVSVVLNPASITRQAARWSIGLLPTQGMISGYKAQVKLNLLTQLLFFGSTLLLWRGNDINGSLKRITNFMSVVIAVRILAWMGWYGFTMFEVATTETVTVTFRANGKHVIKEVKDGDGVIHYNIPWDGVDNAN